MTCGMPFSGGRSFVRELMISGFLISMNENLQAWRN
jgi:hypothetical protein